MRGVVLNCYTWIGIRPKIVYCILCIKYLWGIRNIEMCLINICAYIVEGSHSIFHKTF